MANLQLPAINEVVLSPTESAAYSVAATLKEVFGEVTTTSLHSGTRLYRLLGLDQPYDNLHLVNVYNCTRDRLREELERRLPNLNANDEYRLSLAPRGYKVGPNLVDVSNIAYAACLLVMSTDPNDLVPKGLVFVQTYGSTREETPQVIKEYHAQRQRSNESSVDDEFEYDPEPEPEPEPEPNAR